MTRLVVHPGGTTEIARPRTYLHLVLDESVSMEGYRDATISLYNEFLDSQRRDRIDELFVTLTKFSDADRVQTVYKAVSVAEAPPLTKQTYRPAGATALYDGVARSILDAEKASGPGDRVVVVILTDGEENSSKEVTAAQLSHMRAEREARGNWTFTLLGVGTGAMLDSTARKVGIRVDNVATADDIRTAIQKVDASVRHFRGTDDVRSDRFWEPAKRWKRPQWASSPTIVSTEE